MAVKDLERLRTFGVPEINKAIDAFYEITASPEFREMERLRAKARRDEELALSQARNEVKLEVALKMKEMGEAVEKIHIFTGLPTETIEKM
jgi:phage-related protein